MPNLSKSYLSAASPTVAQFVRECCETSRLDEGLAGTPTRMLFEAYRAWKRYRGVYDPFNITRRVFIHILAILNPSDHGVQPITTLKKTRRQIRCTDVLLLNPSPEKFTPFMKEPPFHVFGANGHELSFSSGPYRPVDSDFSAQSLEEFSRCRKYSTCGDMRGRKSSASPTHTPASTSTTTPIFTLAAPPNLPAEDVMLDSFDTDEGY